MSLRSFITYLFCGLALSIPAKSIFVDKEMVSVIKRGLDHAYNYDFRLAEQQFEHIKAKYPLSPAYFLCTAIKLNLQHPEIVADESELYLKFKKLLQRSIKLSDSLLRINPNDLEGIFFKMNSMSLLGLKYSQAKQFSKAMNIAKETYEYVKKALAHKEKFHEFYFTSGLYNYYVVQYPESHPVIKPFMIFFQNGNKQLGLQDLDFASKNSTFSEAEALFFLANINFKYEFGLDKALAYQKTLISRFPRNNFYQYKLGELAIAKQDVALLKKCIDSTLKNHSVFYKAVTHILQGSLHHLMGDKPEQAKAEYQEALHIIEKNKIHSPELSSLAFLGLARFFAKEKNRAQALKYYKLTEDNSSNKYYEKEAVLYAKTK